MPAKSAAPEVPVKANALAAKPVMARVDADNVPMKNVMLPLETCRRTIMHLDGRTAL